MSCTSASIRAGLLHEDELPGQPIAVLGADGIVDVMVDVGNAVDHPDDPALQGERLRRAARVADDPVAHLFREVQADAVPLQAVDHAQRMLVVTEFLTEAPFQAAVEHLLADVPERRMAEVVAQPDRLHQVLVQAQRPGNRARDGGDLERVREAGAVVIATGRDEHLRLVRQPAERLAVDDPIAVALKRGA